MKSLFVLCAFFLGVLLGSEVVVGQEKFLDGLASLLLSTSRETITMTEQTTKTLSLTDVIKEYSTHVNQLTKTHTSTITSTNTIWSTTNTEVTKWSTTYVTEISTKTEDVTVRLTSSVIETEFYRMLLHSRTVSMPVVSLTSTSLTTETVVNNITDNRVVYESLTSTRTSIQIRRHTDRQLDLETVTQTHTTTVTIEANPRGGNLARSRRLTRVNAVTTISKPTSTRPAQNQPARNIYQNRYRGKY